MLKSDYNRGLPRGGRLRPTPAKGRLAAVCLLLAAWSFRQAAAAHPPWARAWDNYSRQAYLRGADSDSDGLNDDEERLTTILWGAVTGRDADWFDGAASPDFQICAWCSADDAVQPVALPFPFVWDTLSWSQVWIGANGCFGFDGGQPATNPVALPAPSAGANPFFAVFWQHLHVDTASGGRVWTATRDAQRFVICWENLWIGRSSRSRLSFQAELHRDGEMIWRYQVLDDGGGRTPRGIVGAQRQGLGWSLPERILRPPLALRVAAVRGLSPHNADTDGDGIPDGVEFFYYVPSRPGGRLLNPVVADNPHDIDRDGLDVMEEYLHGGLDPFHWDSDGDMLGDGYEVSVGLLPNSSAGMHGLYGDPDGDGLDNITERLHRTNPRLVDTDGDGRGDADEIAAGANPAGPGALPSTQWLAPVQLTLGDPGLDGQTEAYVMHVDPITGDTRGFTFQNTAYGTVQTKTVHLAIGGRYVLSVDHLGSVRSSQGIADPDYTAGIAGIEGTVLSVSDPDHLLGTHLSNTPAPAGTPPLDTNRHATVWVQSRMLADGTIPVTDPALAIRFSAWTAGRSATAGALATAQLTDPGVLVLPAYAAAMGDVPPAKVRIYGIQATTGFTRWLRVNDPSRITYKFAGMSAFAAPSQSDILIPGTLTAWVDVEIRARGTWPVGTTMQVEALVKNAAGQIVARSGRARLIAQVIAAIGDSLTYGFRRRRDGTHEMPLWRVPWLNYPSPDSWNAYVGQWSDVRYQGSRGYLRQHLTPTVSWAGHPANGHGPDHCGFPGAQTTDIINMLADASRPYPRAAVAAGPCDMVVVYFIGLNDIIANRGAGSVYAYWRHGLDSILARRAGQGRTLLVGVTLPRMGSYYGLYSSDRQRQLLALNANIRSYTTAAPLTRYVVADIENVPHDFDDDGLHFMDAGYSRIEQIIRQAILNGMRMQP